MRSLSAALLAAQQSPSARPYVRVTVSDRTGGVARAPYQRLYTGSEPDGPLPLLWPATARSCAPGSPAASSITSG